MIKISDAEVKANSILSSFIFLGENSIISLDLRSMPYHRNHTYYLLHIARTTPLVTSDGILILDLLRVNGRSLS